MATIIQYGGVKGQGDRKGAPLLYMIAVYACFVGIIEGHPCGRPGLLVGTRGYTDYQ